jgi:hypothetical protein
LHFSFPFSRTRTRKSCLHNSFLLSSEKYHENWYSFSPCRLLSKTPIISWWLKINHHLTWPSCKVSSANVFQQLPNLSSHIRVQYNAAHRVPERRSELARSYKNLSLQSEAPHFHLLMFSTTPTHPRIHTQISRIASNRHHQSPTRKLLSFQLPELISFHFIETLPLTYAFCKNKTGVYTSYRIIRHP